MKILIIHDSKIPVFKYGGIERVIWGLGKALNDLNHDVYFLVPKGSYCPFAKGVFEYNPEVNINSQIPEYIDVVHSEIYTKDAIQKPYLINYQCNVNHPQTFDINTVFISHNQASRYHGSCVVYNGLDWNDYNTPDLNNKRKYFHFLADAAWKVKNVNGAIAITRKAHEKLVVMGGKRLNFNMGFRLTPDLHVSFKGMVGGDEKFKHLQNSKGLIFPVLWHEPFGLAITESLYYGCPVFGTKYGSLPELITNEVGVTSNSINELAEGLRNVDSFSKKYCHEYAADNFNSMVMTQQYLLLYEKVMNGETLHQQKPYFAQEDISPVKRLPMTA